MVPMAVYALLGGSRTLSVSTTSTIAILTASTLVAGQVAAGSPDPARALATLTLLVGAILLVARLLRVGVVIDNISEATLTGIKVGVGLTVAAGQLPKLLGIPGSPSADNFFSEIRAVLDQLGSASWTTIVFSAATIAVLVGLRRLAPRVPSPLAPSFDHVGGLLPGAFAIAIMVFLETLAVGRSVRQMSEPPIDNNQELVASGLASVAGAFFRAMPAAGGFSQTAINRGPARARS
jgi:SulP family sulfate permease